MMQQATAKAPAVHEVDGAIPVSRTVRVRGPAPISAVRPAAIPLVPVRQRSFWPILPALCCLGLILFLIAATIVLSLIPLYTSRKNVSTRPVSERSVINAPLPSGSNVSVGSFNAQQRALIQQALQSQLNSNPATRGSTVTVESATALANNVGKRQVTVVVATIVQIVVVITSPSRFRLHIHQLLNSFTISSSLAAELAALGLTTTTTVATTTTTSNRTRRLVRRSLEEGGAPAGVVYIDANELAATDGNVTSVSFYADETCALATIEFGAFELLSRTKDTNNAELVLKQRSGPLKLSAKNDLKPYMNMITIRLCSGKILDDISSGGCQGHQFPVLSYHYIGVRSDSCRLGFAPVVLDPIDRTTWKVAENADPFFSPYTKVKYVPADYTILHSVNIDTSQVPAKKEEIKENAGTATGPRVLFMGSYPSRRCGIAKYLEDMTRVYPGAYSIVAVDEKNFDATHRHYTDEVIYRLNQEDRDQYYEVADLFNKGAYDILNIQHEYGLYGGMAGEYILALMGAVRKPVVVTMHTVIPEPSPMYLSITRALCAITTRVVVLADLGRRLLIDVYGIDETKIVVIAHGVPDVPFTESLDAGKLKMGIDPKTPTVSTFGLLHRNKNIQLALKAMETVVKYVPNVKYIVIGQTHPGILQYEGEAYRRELESNVTALGLTRNVEFVNKFVTDSEILDYLGATDVYLTPYAREDQYVSGTLSWAVGVGKVVVSTPFLYAKDLLADGRGFLVPFEEPKIVGSTIARALLDETVRNAARRQAYRFGRHMTWPIVTRKLEETFRELLLYT